jgi:hypothetical protein
MGNGNHGYGYRHNHYVPEWYQKRFLMPNTQQHWYLDLKPEVRSNGSIKWTRRDLLRWGPRKCFAQNDLYTTQWGDIESTDIEQFFFGELDVVGKAAVEYFSDFEHPSVSQEHHYNLMRYMSAQKLRTPKGLAYLNGFANLNNQNLTLLLLQKIHNIFCAIWTECIWQIADASESDTKLIISDHPITVYNRECFPDSSWCSGYNDPDIRLNASHTYFPLSLEKVLILTNLCWVRDPYQSATNMRPNPDLFRGAIFNFQAIQTQRKLTESEVIEINYITKRRAWRYIAAAEKEWLFPEKRLANDHWRKLGDGYLLMPEPRHVYMGGEVIFGFDNGRSEAFGPYGQRPWQQDYLNTDRDRRETIALERFKAEWATTYGPNYRGITFQFASRTRPPRAADSPEMHERYLGRDAEMRRRPGERQRRRRLVR